METALWIIVGILAVPFVVGGLFMALAAGLSVYGKIKKKR